MKVVERVLVVIGVVLIGTYVAARLNSATGSKAAIESFDAQLETAETEAETEPSEQSRQTFALSDEIDFSLWAKGRIEAYHATSRDAVGRTLAVLSIPELDLEVPVFNGTTDPVLDLGVGRIFGTSWPGLGGNLGLAGHRDGFFRVLQEIEVGDEIRVRHDHGEDTYVVEELTIVTPDDVSSLGQTDESTLTLVTCYPFYFVGSAPERFVVRAVATSVSTS